MKKKGFTLIELLAVIVILAVIAVIATPAVLNVIEDSKKSAAEASARSIVGAAKTHYMKNIMDNKPNSNVDLSTNTLKYDGEQAKKGLLSYDTNGNVTGKMYISGYCIEVSSDGTITSEKVSIDDCNIADISTGGNTSGGNQGGSGSTEVTKTYTNGEVVYFDVKNGVKCSESNYHSDNSKTGYNGISTTTPNQNGCLKFYAFNDTGSTKINLLLDHNTTAIAQWNVATNNGPSASFLQILNDNTKDWKGTLSLENYSIYRSLDVAGTMVTIDYTIKYKDENYKARLITAGEIANITGKTSWDEKTSYDIFYLDTNTTSASTTCKSGNVTGCKYGWLYDRTSLTCKNYGCLNNSDVRTDGYWTATAKAFGGNQSSPFAWKISYDANLSYSDTSNIDDDYTVNGVRPVIEVSKSKLK